MRFSSLLRMGQLLPLIATGLFAAPVAEAQTDFRWIVKPMFEDAGAAFDGVVPLMSEGRWGLMGADGNWSAPPRYEALGRARDGHIPVKVSGAWGIHALDGTEVIPAIYLEIGQWADRIPARTQRGWMVLDQKGREISGPLPMDRLRGNEGHCITGQIGDRAYVYDDRTNIQRDVEGGYVTSRGAMRLYGPSAGIVRYNVDGSLGFISCTWLKTVGEGGYEALRRIMPESGLVAAKKDGRWGLLRAWDTGVREILGFTHDGLRDFTESLLPFRDPSGKWGYLNAEGTPEISAVFDQAYSFSDGIAGVKVGDYRGFILPDGSFAAEPLFEDFWRHAKGIAPVKQSGKWGVIAFDATAPSASLDFHPLALDIFDSPGTPSLQISVPHKYFRQDFFRLQTIVRSDSGRLVATLLDEGEGIEPSHRSEIAIWDTHTGLSVSRMYVPTLEHAAFVGDTGILAVGEVTGHVSLWSVRTGDQLLSLRPGLAPISRLAVTPDGTFLAAGDQDTVYLWNLQTGRFVKRLSMDVRALAPSADGKAFLLADGRGATFRISAETGSVQQITNGAYETAMVETRHGEMPVLEDVTLAPGPVLAAISGGLGMAGPRSLLVNRDGSWQRAELPEMFYNVSTLDVAPDGTRILVAQSESFSIFDSSNLERVVHYSVEGFLSGETRTTMAEGLPVLDTIGFLKSTEALLAIGAEGNPIAVYDPSRNGIRGTLGKAMDLPIFGVQATITGHTILNLTGSGDITVFDLTKGTTIGSIPAAALPVTEYGPHGTLFTGGDGMGYYATEEGDAVRINPVDLSVSRVTSSAIPMTTNAALPAKAKDALSAQRIDFDYGFSLSKEAGIILVARGSGVLQLFDLQTGKQIAALVFFKGGEWAVTTTAGFFDGSYEGIKSIATVTDAAALPVAKAALRYHRPEMVREVLRGDPLGLAAQNATRLSEESTQIAPEPTKASAEQTTASAKRLTTLPGVKLKVSPAAAAPVPQPVQTTQPATVAAALNTLPGVILRAAAAPKETEVATKAPLRTLPGVDLASDAPAPASASDGVGAAVEAPVLPELKLNTGVSD